MAYHQCRKGNADQFVQSIPELMFALIPFDAWWFPDPAWYVGLRSINLTWDFVIQRAQCGATEQPCPMPQRREEMGLKIQIYLMLGYGNMCD